MGTVVIQPSTLRVALPQNQLIPKEGPKALPALLDFTGTVGTYTVDLLSLEQLGIFSMLQTIFIDLSNSANNLTVTFPDSGQVIIAKPHTQGYYPVLCPIPMKLRFSSAPAGSLIPLFLINVPIAGVTWPSQ
jgi:hypothetical protein